MTAVAEGGSRAHETDSTYHETDSTRSRARDKKLEARTTGLLEEQSLKHRLQEARKKLDALAERALATGTQALGTPLLTRSPPWTGIDATTRPTRGPTVPSSKGKGDERTATATFDRPSPRARTATVSETSAPGASPWTHTPDSMADKGGGAAD
jgi:hypothetical protein